LILAWGFGVGDAVDFTSIRTLISLVPKAGLLYANRYIKMGLKSAVDKATRYGLDGQKIESHREAKFSPPVHIGSGAHPASYTMRKGALSPR
jgi:hypothetical protein